MFTRALLAGGLLFAGMVAGGPVLAEPGLAVKAGDVWVMAGDSITAQRQHSNYIEAFFRTRYPNLKPQFRNSGIGGNTTGSVLARFDYDLAAFKPTIISIELGMNDVGAGDDPAKYIAGMQKLIDQIRAVQATPVLISSSPVNDGSKMDNWKGDRCRRIHPYTLALAKLAQENNVLFIDQYHPLLEMWGANKAADAKDPVNLEGDAVHPGPTGQLTMAAVILAGLGVEREVSSATLKADGTIEEAKGCKITDAKAAGGGLTFTRLDERSPWPIHAKCRNALKLMPQIADLSRYLLQVTGLPEGRYAVLTNGVEAAHVTSGELAAGWNMSTVATGVIAERGTKLVDQIAQLQGPLNNAWRAASKAKDAARLAEAQAAIDAAETALAAACQPVEIKFEIKPVAK